MGATRHHHHCLVEIDLHGVQGVSVHLPQTAAHCYPNLAIQGRYFGPCLAHLLGHHGQFWQCNVVGVLPGLVVGSSRLVSATVYPLLTAFNALPNAAFIAIFGVWFGLVWHWPGDFHGLFDLVFARHNADRPSEMTSAHEGIGYLMICAVSAMQMSLA